MSLARIIQLDDGGIFLLCKVTYICGSGSIKA